MRRVIFVSPIFVRRIIHAREGANMAIMKLARLNLLVQRNCVSEGQSIRSHRIIRISRPYIKPYRIPVSQNNVLVLKTSTIEPISIMRMAKSIDDVRTSLKKLIVQPVWWHNCRNILETPDEWYSGVNHAVIGTRVCYL